MKEIQLTQGFVTVVDDDVYEWADRFSWIVTTIRQMHSTKRYASRYSLGSHETRKRIYLHRVIMKAPKGITVDHIDHDELNNLRSNLRLATTQQNQFNRRPTNPTGYKGVRAPQRETHGYGSFITFNGHVRRIGTFLTAPAAARAYDAEAVKFFGEFAWLNFPEEHGREAR